MAKHGRNIKLQCQKKPSNELGLDAALQTVKDLSYAKFDEAVDVAINLGIDLLRVSKR